MSNSFLKYIGFVAILLAIPWAMFQWKNSSTQWEDHAACLAALLPSENRAGYRSTINHHIEKAVTKARKDGLAITRSDVRSKAVELNETWMQQSGSLEKYNQAIKDIRRRCAES